MLRYKINHSNTHIDILIRFSQYVIMYILFIKSLHYLDVDVVLTVLDGVDVGILD